LQNRQNLFSTGKVANWLLSGGEAVAEPHPFIIEVLHCFVGFVINTLVHDNFYKQQKKFKFGQIIW
jgi:hypothetical protein